MECFLVKHDMQLRVDGLIDSSAAGEAFIHPRLLPAVKKFFHIKVLRIKHGSMSLSDFATSMPAQLRKCSI